MIANFTDNFKTVRIFQLNANFPDDFKIVQMQMETPNAANIVLQTYFCLGGRGYSKFR